MGWKWRHGDVSRHANGNLKDALGRVKAKTYDISFANDLSFSSEHGEAEQRMIPNSEFHLVNALWTRLSLLLPPLLQFSKSRLKYHVINKKKQTHTLGLLKLMSCWRIGTLIYFKSISLKSITTQYVMHLLGTQPLLFVLLPYLHSQVQSQRHHFQF